MMSYRPPSSLCTVVVFHCPPLSFSLSHFFSLAYVLIVAFTLSLPYLYFSPLFHPSNSNISRKLSQVIIMY